MNKQIKKLLCAALSVAMVAGTAVLPTTASADDFTPIFAGDTVLKEWKFDFGAEGATPADGFTLVTPDTNFTANNEGEYQYGFLGTDPEDYNLTNRYDGWTTQKGQTIELAAGNDAIGVVGAGGTEKEGGKGNDIFGNKADKYYPTRFALKVTDDTYYRVKATVTTLDPTKDATVSLYTERKHPLYTEKKITAGQTYTESFSVRVTPIYYVQSAPTGQIADEMLTVGVLGENSALASVEIQQVQTIPTVWVLGDSTVTDGNTTLPFFPLQNYTGVGTGLTKYLRRDYAMVNEGEGGLNAADNNHFNMVNSRIQAGDYMYVEYGHNHKSDGPAGYKSCLDKYYNACHEKGAKLLIVSPVQSDNSWNETTKRWDSRFGGDDNFEGAGKSYVAEKVAGDATDVAFVNLTETSVAFVDKVTIDNGEVKTAAQFYYQTAKDGATDPSHPNDAGAENFAYCAFEAAKAVTDTTQKAVLADLLANMTGETPNLVPQSVMAGGLGGSAWPKYIVPSTEKYPVLINNVEFNEDGTVKKVDVVTRDAETQFATYGIIIITIFEADGTEKGKIYAADQVDHSTGKGPQTVANFRGNVTLEEGDTYSAVVVEAFDSNEGLQVVENGKTYSAVYKPTDIAEHLIVNDRNDDKYENFDYYGATYEGDEADGLEKYNNWTKRGSAGMKLPLGEDNGTKYATISTDGAKNGAAGQGSTYVAKDFVKEIGSSGRYLVSMDMKYESGGGMNVKFVTENTDKAPWGSDSMVLFSVGTDGKVTLDSKEVGQISATKFSNVQYIIDMDLGTASLSVDGGDEVTADLADYKSIAVNAVHPKFTGFMFEGNKVAFNVKVANLTVAKMKDKQLPEYTLSLGEYDESKGFASVMIGAPTGFELSYADGNAVVTANKADAKATLLEVKRKADGTLESVKATPLTFADALTQTTAVTAGSTLMLWDSLEGMKPLVTAITAVDTAVADTLTATLNTVVTAKAVAAERYVFMGWLDKDGKKVSDDAVYSFRLRGDTELTPDFVKEPGIEDITSFALSADKTRVKAAKDATVNVNIIDAKDADGTPISKATNEDADWSCSDSVIDVTNGVMTIPEDYTSDNAKNAVTVTCKLNEISKSTVIYVYTSAYYEDFSAVANSGDWIDNTGTAQSLFGIIDAATNADFPGMKKASNGKALVIGNNQSGAGKNLAYNRDMGLSKYSVLKFGFDIEPFTIASGSRRNVLRFVDTDGTEVFNIDVNTGGGKSKFNGTEIDGFTAGVLVSVDMELDFTNHTMKYKLTADDGKVLAENNTGVAITANNLDRMNSSGDWQYGKFAIDNIYADYAE